LLIMYGSSYMGAYGGGKRAAQGVGGETWGKEAIGETQT
jgi:hypothetical protein